MPDNPGRPGQQQRGLTFFLGVGAQKAGTTWLFDYLAGHPACDLPRIKEVHGLDTYFLDDVRARFSRYARKQTRHRLRRALRHPSPTRLAMVWTHWRRDRALCDLSRYFDFVLSAHRRGQVVGECTPRYALLRAAQFRAVRAGLLARGLRPRVVFVMRDPVARFYSAVRHDFRMRGAPGPFDAARELARTLDAPMKVRLGDYAATVTALERAFPAEELHFEFYESLFTDRAVAALCGHLGIAPEPARLERAVNVGIDAPRLSDDQLAALRRRFDPVYRFCRDRFGDRVPSDWLE